MKTYFIVVAATLTAVGAASIALHERFWQGLLLVGLGTLTIIFIDVFEEES